MVVPMRLAKATSRTELVPAWVPVVVIGRDSTTRETANSQSPTSIGAVRCAVLGVGSWLLGVVMGLGLYGSKAKALYDSQFMHPELQEAIDLHESIVAEAGNALVGYDTEKALANVVLLSEIPTTYDKEQKRQVNAGNLLLRGVPGVGKTFFGVILAAISNATFARFFFFTDTATTE